MVKRARRHVVAVGKRSLAVILPKSWASRLGVKAGDEALLILGEEGSIFVVLRPRGCEAPRGGVVEVGGLSRGLLAKELLAAYALGFGRVSLRAKGVLEALPLRALFTTASCEGSQACFLLPRAPASPEKILGTVLRLLEDTVDEFSKFLEEPGGEGAGRIHRLEERMDMACYMFFSSIFRGLSAPSERGPGAGSVLDIVAGTIVVGAAEDLVDSLDRLVWRIQETGTVSRDLLRIFNKLRSVLDDTITCLDIACGEADMEKIYWEILGVRSVIKDSMARSPQPVQPMLAELEIAVNSTEKMFETALLKTLTRTRRAAEDSRACP